jgi:hypothetical protein
MEKDKLHKATHTGVLKIGSGHSGIPCAVLEDGTRVLTQGGFLTTIGRSRTPKAGTGVTVAEVPTFLAANNLKPYIDNDLLVSTKPIKYSHKGRIVLGYEAELLPRVCEVYLKARDNKDLKGRQKDIAAKADLIMRALAHVGIIALVDEATNYQEVRDRLALEKILAKYISKELLPWTKQFPDEFYEQMFRLKDWQYKPLSVKRPGVVGRYTNDLIYARLAPGVLTELRRLTPRDAKGRTRHRFFQRLTEDIGHPKLREHISNVITLMKASPDKNWSIFYRLLQRALPKFGENIPFVFMDDGGDDESEV